MEGLYLGVLVWVARVYLPLRGYPPLACAVGEIE